MKVPETVVVREKTGYFAECVHGADNRRIFQMRVLKIKGF